MKYIIKPRGMGKTTDLIRLSAATNIPILVPYKVNADYINNLAAKLGCNITVLVYDKNYKYNDIKSVYIDEVDAFLQMLLNKNNIRCDIGTLTIDN